MVYRDTINQSQGHTIPHKEGCYIEEKNDVIPFGQSVTVGHCTEITCGRKWMNYNSCGSTIVDIPNCHLVEDLSKPYPDCCPKIKCEAAH
ncbi:hypothetical protein HF086_010654 [Spodoptera exigua]|uniref:Single domain-containing protein n=1 Tax=Spodoptera exigua TaxID=7107 RepID=A0A922SH92_SPOEX|nr:hypothetical protein HF086_010654 [Spodoptera exigua]